MADAADGSSSTQCERSPTRSRQGTRQIAPQASDEVYIEPVAGDGAQDIGSARVDILPGRTRGRERDGSDSNESALIFLTIPNSDDKADHNYDVRG